MSPTTFARLSWSFDSRIECSFVAISRAPRAFSSSNALASAIACLNASRSLANHCATNFRPRYSTNSKNAAFPPNAIHTPSIGTSGEVGEPAASSDLATSHFTSGGGTLAHGPRTVGGEEHMHDDRDRILTEIWERRKLAIDLRQKYELYFVSLIFTLAAASVQ